MENGWDSPGEAAEEWQGLIAPFLAGHQNPMWEEFLQTSGVGTQEDT